MGHVIRLIMWSKLPLKYILILILLLRYLNILSEHQLAPAENILRSGSSWRRCNVWEEGYRRCNTTFDRRWIVSNVDEGCAVERWRGVDCLVYVGQIDKVNRKADVFATVTLSVDTQPAMDVGGSWLERCGLDANIIIIIIIMTIYIAPWHSLNQKLRRLTWY